MSFPFKIDSANQGSFETSFYSKQPKLEPKLVLALSKTKHLFWLFRFYTKTESFDVSIEPKQTKDQPKQFDWKHILAFFRKLRVVSVCFEIVLFVLVVSIQVRIPETNREKKILCFWCNKTYRNTTETDIVLQCFGSNRIFFLFVLRTPLCPPAAGHVTSCLKFSIQPKMASSVKLQQMKEMRVFNPSVTIPQASSDGLSRSQRDHCKRAILFLSSSKILTPIPNSPPGECVPPAFVAGGGQTRQAERGMGGQYFGRREKQDCPLTMIYLSTVQIFMKFKKYTHIFRPLTFKNYKSLGFWETRIFSELIALFFLKAEEFLVI